MIFQQNDRAEIQIFGSRQKLFRRSTGAREPISWLAASTIMLVRGWHLIEVSSLGLSEWKMVIIVFCSFGSVSLIERTTTSRLQSQRAIRNVDHTNCCCLLFVVVCCLLFVVCCCLLFVVVCCLLLFVVVCCLVCVTV